MEFEVIRDVTGESKSCADVRSYKELFRDRYERLKDLISGGSELHRVPLNQVPARAGDDVFLVGLVQDHRVTRKGDRIVRIEDPTGEVVVWVSQKKDLAQEVDTILPDGAVGFEAKVPSNLSDEDSPLVWGNELYWPESQELNDGNTSLKPSQSNGPLAVLTSDFHIGSTEFLRSSFQRFLRWLSGKEGEPEKRRLAERVEHVLIAGDAVDGGGIYPGQERELEIRDVGKQYKQAAKYLSEVPEDVTIILAPGNHDPIRLAEPQPAIPDDIGAPLVDQGVTLVGNPCFFKIGDVRFLMYHGEGFDDLVSAGVGLEYSDKERLLVETLKRGHLAPVYRNSDRNQAPTAPEREDYLVIDTPIDVFHAGHSHRFGVGEVNGVTLALTGTFQGQTSFQRSKGISPDPGKVALINLETGSLERVLSFVG